MRPESLGIVIDFEENASGSLDSTSFLAIIIPSSAPIRLWHFWQTHSSVQRDEVAKHSQELLEKTPGKEHHQIYNTKEDQMLAIVRQAIWLERRNTNIKAHREGHENKLPEQSAYEDTIIILVLPTQYQNQKLQMGKLYWSIKVSRYW